MNLAPRFDVLQSGWPGSNPSWKSYPDTFSHRNGVPVIFIEKSPSVDQCLYTSKMAIFTLTALAGIEGENLRICMSSGSFVQRVGVSGHDHEADHKFRW